MNLIDLVWLLVVPLALLLGAWGWLAYQRHLDNRPITNMERLQRLVKRGYTNYERYGLVRVHIWDNMIIFNYARHRMYDPTPWNWFETESRGLILDMITGEIISRPFPKFFNIEETPPLPEAKMVSVIEKVDGSMIQMFFKERDQMYGFATRGVFADNLLLQTMPGHGQALWAKEWAARTGMNISDLDPEWTYIFEVVYLTNRIIIEYGPEHEGLWLIGARHKHTGVCMAETDLDNLAFKQGWRRPQTYPVQKSAEDIRSYMDALGEMVEGAIVRFDDGKYYKVKTSKWFELNRSKSGVSFKTVFRAYEAGETLAEFLGDKDDEFFAEITALYNRIAAEYERRYTAIMNAFNSRPEGLSKPEYAAWVTTNHPEYKNYLYSLYSPNFRLREAILHQMRVDRNI